MQPRPAASVVVLRDGPRDAIELFCVRRHKGSPFLGGALVFPGGKVDASDATAGWAALSRDPRDAPASFVAEDTARNVDARSLAVAACRELLEEAEILPVRLDADGVSRLQAAVASGSSLAEQLERLGLKLALDALVPWARWITPTAESRRFDARFYLLALPEGQVGRCDQRETTEGFWATPAAVLERWERGELFLAPPTTRTLELLSSAASVSDALEVAARQTLRPICPRFVAADPPMLVLPGDPEHEVTESCVDGPTRFVLRDGRFVGTWV